MFEENVGQLRADFMVVILIRFTIARANFNQIRLSGCPLVLLLVLLGGSQWLSVLIDVILCCLT